MAYHHPDPFWDFIRNFDPNGASTVNNGGSPPEFLRGFPFFHPAHAHPGHHHHGPGGRHRGRRQHHGPPPNPWAGPFAWAEWVAPDVPSSQNQQNPSGPAPAAPAAAQAAHQQDKEKSDSPDTLMDDSDVPDPAEVTPDEDEEPQTNSTNPSPRGRGHCRRGNDRRWNGRGGCRRNNNNNQENPFPFDLSSLLTNLSSHPFVQNLQAQAAEVAQAATAAAAASTSNQTPTGPFSPPLDLFSTPSAYVLHLPIPGALKPDIGVDWDPERNVLRVAGVVHRAGDEEFQKMLVQGERRVGEFRREVRLPPKTWAAADETAREDEIDADGITAKMEDGVLVVTVPKVEKEWTEIRKVDIE